MLLVLIVFFPPSIWLISISQIEGCNGGGDLWVDDAGITLNIQIE